MWAVKRVWSWVCCWNCNKANCNCNTAVDLTRSGHSPGMGVLTCAKLIIVCRRLCANWELLEGRPTSKQLEGKLLVDFERLLGRGAASGSLWNCWEWKEEVSSQKCILGWLWEKITLELLWDKSYGKDKGSTWTQCGGREWGNLLGLLGNWFVLPCSLQFSLEDWDPLSASEVRRVWNTMVLICHRSQKENVCKYRLLIKMGTHHADTLVLYSFCW